MATIGPGSERAPHDSAARRLLQRVLATQWFAPDAVARALVISDVALRTYLSGSRPIPLDRQLCLAQFVIECMPPLARAGHRLRGQVAAAMAYESGATQTHGHAPPSRVWPAG